MSYDEQLAERIRSALASVPVVEKKMFGGLQFMIDGKIAVGATVDGDLLVRCDPSRTEELIARPGAQRADMRGRKMSTGWITVSPEESRGADLQFWVAVALENRALDHRA
ncbi:TfoX/Sxy family protein [Rhodococcus sp. H36-A4]|uniref:TfoX/Sxy family protein n=1 Tax=Rhodococcus sp. H36-A4 TaxID=3004353 RepID=UPI0022B0315F|nr:TfoX/Sxy family protein [Rhodococcus sp. H36-A4]MCZ4077528.1 TfoX/Sxy family protein [Rhodococcus sp. H36-A4]